jgi:hypothetical protein
LPDGHSFLDGHIIACLIIRTCLVTGRIKSKNSPLGACLMDIASLMDI